MTRRAGVSMDFPMCSIPIRLSACTALLLAGCSWGGRVLPVPPGGDVFPYAAERMAAVVVTARPFQRPTSAATALLDAPGDADGGSAAPIAPDGYFLTADHVLAKVGDCRPQLVYLGMHIGGVRIVWRSEADDLALLHAPVGTPKYYLWSEPLSPVASGTPVVNGGVITGLERRTGRILTRIPPESLLVRSRRFQHDIRLLPGDSGGPVLDRQGRLLGINSAVEFFVPVRTAYFINSEAVRPNTTFLDLLIRKDRNARAAVGQ